MKKSKLILGAFLLSVSFAAGALALSPLPFNDISGHWAEDDIMWASGKGLVMGDEGKDTFRPNDAVTRAELVTVMKRYDDRMVKKMMEMEAQMAEIKKMMDPNYFPVVDSEYYLEHVGAPVRYVCESAVEGSRVYRHTDLVPPFEAHYYDSEGAPIDAVETKNCQMTTIEFYDSKVSH